MTPERWRRVEEIFQSAMDRDARSRLSWVEGACNGDEELRQEVTSLIALNTRPVILDEPAYEIAADLLEGGFDLPTGTLFGPNRIEARIGTGGMGSVYRAVDSRLHRPVAIKVCEAEWTERFEREAKAVASLWSYSRVRHSPTASGKGRFRSSKQWPSPVRSAPRWTSRISGASFTGI